MGDTNPTDVADRLRELADELEDHEDDSDGLPNGWVEDGPRSHPPYREFGLSNSVSIWIDRDGDWFVTVDGEKKTWLKNVGDLQRIIETIQEAPRLRDRNRV